ncbi:uncharacterized protein [Diadema setosum]|uniref:uncharacterized protein n=1 Tax=Diadema setosum TaxID=31175 RepID=UPI003B3A1747
MALPDSENNDDIDQMMIVEIKEEPDWGDYHDSSAEVMVLVKIEPDALAGSQAAAESTPDNAESCGDLESSAMMVAGEHSQSEAAKRETASEQGCTSSHHQKREHLIHQGQTLQCCDSSIREDRKTEEMKSMKKASSNRKRKRSCGFRCLAYGCGNTHKKGFIIHGMPGNMPKETERFTSVQQKWIDFILKKRKDVEVGDLKKYKRITLCSGHFLEEDYISTDVQQYKRGFRTKNGPSLKPDARPTQDRAIDPFPPSWFIPARLASPLVTEDPEPAHHAEAITEEARRETSSSVETVSVEDNDTEPKVKQRRESTYVRRKMKSRKVQCQPRATKMRTRGIQVRPPRKLTATKGTQADITVNSIGVDMPVLCHDFSTQTDPVEISTKPCNSSSSLVDEVTEDDFEVDVEGDDERKDPSYIPTGDLPAFEDDEHEKVKKGV